MNKICLSYSIIFSSIFAGVSQSIFSKTKKDGLNQYLKRFNNPESKVFNSGSLSALILSLNLTNLNVPLVVEFSRLNNSIHLGSEEERIFFKFCSFFSDEYIFTSFNIKRLMMWKKWMRKLSQSRITVSRNAG